MIINPQISIPPDVNVRDPIKASTTNGILSALRQERTPKQLSMRSKNVFDLYSFMPFAVTMATPTTVNVSSGYIYVHALSTSPWGLTVATPRDLGIGGVWPSLAYVSIQLVRATFFTACYVFPGRPPSSATELRIPIALFTRYGTSAADYGYSLTQVLHVGDIHVCKAFAATT